jgi:hypothetical protein
MFLLIGILSSVPVKTWSIGKRKGKTFCAAGAVAYHFFCIFEYSPGACPEKAIT